MNKKQHVIIACFHVQFRLGHFGLKHTFPARQPSATHCRGFIYRLYSYISYQVVFMLFFSLGQTGPLNEVVGRTLVPIVCALHWNLVEVIPECRAMVHASSQAGRRSQQWGGVGQGCGNPTHQPRNQPPLGIVDLVQHLSRWFATDVVLNPLHKCTWRWYL